METQIDILKAKAIDTSSVMGFVVLENKTIFETSQYFYNKKFLNASLKEISVSLVDKYRYSILTIKENDYADAFKQISSKITPNLKTIIVIFADACLLENNVIDIAINRCELSKFVNLNKSFVCDVNYFKNENFKTLSESEVLNVARTNKIIDKNTFISDLEFAFQNIQIKNLMKNKVKFLSLSDAKIDFTVTVGENTVINNGVILLGETVIDENCNLENVTVKDSFIGANCKLSNVVITNSIVKKGNTLAGVANKKHQAINSVIIE